MNFKMKKAASAKLGKRVAAAAASVALVGASVPASVLSAMAPSIAFAAANETLTTDDVFGVKVSYRKNEVEKLELGFTKDNVAYVIGGLVTGQDVTYWKNGSAADRNDFALAGVTAEDLTSITVQTWDSSRPAEKLYVASVSNGDKKVALSAATNDSKNYGEITISGKDIKNLAVADGDTIELNTQFQLHMGDIFVYKRYDSVNDYNIAHDDAVYTNKDGKVVSTVALDELGSIEVKVADGYNFRAWNNDDFGTSVTLSGDTLRAAVDAATTMSDKFAILADLSYALGENTLTVNFDAGEGTVTTGDKQQTWTASKASSSANSIKATATPKLTGDTFLGWMDESGEIVSTKSESGYYIADSKLAKISGNEASKAITLTAAYAGQEDTVGSDTALNFVAYSGEEDNKFDNADAVVAAASTEGGSVTIAGGKANELATSTASDYKINLLPVTATAAEGYNFKGWFRTKTSGEKVVLESAPFSTEETLDVATIKAEANHGGGSGATKIDATTFVALFEDASAAKSYSLSYDLNGGSLIDGVLDERPFATVELEVGDGSYTVATKAELEARYQRTGYAVTENKEYITATDGTGKVVPAGSAQSVVDAYGKDGDVTLFINWQLTGNVDGITFAAGDGGEVSAVDKDGKAVTSATFTKNADTAAALSQLSGFTATATPKQGYTLTSWTYKGVKTGVADKKGTIKALSAAGVLTTNDLTALTLDAETLFKNFDGTIWTETAAANNTSFTVTANFKADSYTATFDGVKMSYTVDKDAELPEGTWYDENGNEIADKAALDALVTKDGDVVVLTSKAQPETPTTPTSPSTPTSPIEPVLKEGWNDVTGKGDWVYVENGKKVTSKWVNDGTGWYYLDNTGAMVTGWMQDGFENGVAIWYYLSTGNYGPKGKMATGWIFDGAWYYMNEGGYATYTGQMVRSKAVPGGTVGADGKWIA